MPRVNSAIRWAVPLIALGLVVGGCSSSSSTGNTGTSSASLGAANDINPQDVSLLQDGGNLRLPLSAFPANFNGLTNDGNDSDTADVLRAVMPRAFVADAAGKVSVNTNYFTSIELTSTSPQVVTYTINPKAVWSDGSAMTWEDIASQVNAENGVNKDFEVASTSGFERVDNVKMGVNDHQAIMTYKTPYAEWKGLFSGTTFFYPKTATATPDLFNKSQLDTVTSSSGPFVITNIDKGQNRITVSRNPKWWGATPKLASITYIVLDDAATIPALANNEIDSVGDNVPISTLDQLTTAKNAPGVTVRQTPSNSWYHLTFNGAPGSIMADPALRLAVSKGIDRQGIVTATQNGLAKDPKPLGNHVYLNGQDGYKDNSSAIAFDASAAKSELDALGWKMNGQFREKDGKQLEIRDVFYQAAANTAVAQIVQQNLAAIGVKLTLDPKPGTGFFSDFVIPGDFDMTQFGWVGDSFPLSGLPQIYAYTGDNTQGNYGRIGSPDINTDITNVIQELDPQKAIDDANAIDTKIFAEGFDVPLQQASGNVASRSNVANYGAKGLADLDYTKIGFMK